MTDTPTNADATAPGPEAPAVHWISARAAGRLLCIEVGTFQRIARMTGVRTWHPRGMRHPRYNLADVRALGLGRARERTG